MPQKLRSNYGRFLLHRPMAYGNGASAGLTPPRTIVNSPDARMDED